MSKFIPVEPNKWADMVRAQSEVLHLRRDAVHSANLIGGLQEENANLKAEVQRLTWLQVETLNERNKAEAEVERLTNCKSEADRLEAEVERLREAGDEIEVALRGMMGNYPRSLADGWKEAKEGKRRG